MTALSGWRIVTTTVVMLMIQWECDTVEATGQERQRVTGQLQLRSTSNLFCVKYNPVIPAVNVTPDPSWIFLYFLILLQTYDVILIYWMHTCYSCYGFLFLVWSCFRNMRCSFVWLQVEHELFSSPSQVLKWHIARLLCLLMRLR